MTGRKGRQHYSNFPSSRTSVCSGGKVSISQRLIQARQAVLESSHLLIQIYSLCFATQFSTPQGWPLSTVSMDSVAIWLWVEYCQGGSWQSKGCEEGWDTVFSSSFLVESRCFGYAMWSKAITPINCPSPYNSLFLVSIIIFSICPFRARQGENVTLLLPAPCECIISMAFLLFKHLSVNSSFVMVSLNYPFWVCHFF